MVLRACRYYGQSREYWWNCLTWSLHIEIERELAENPPADRLIQLYFRAQKWWEPPRLPVQTGDGGADEDDDGGVWESPWPERTE